ncbi:hypothetical protein ABET51_03850 [Metabacillus fastidiosus]|uniref:hypothetical protein n=1 Tax=Metabacillus fastidiosus TaxID=1458 RepID=UPI003D2B943B
MNGPAERMIIKKEKTAVVIIFILSPPSLPSNYLSEFWRSFISMMKSIVQVLKQKRK